MLPTVFGENLFDDFFADPFENGFDRSLFGGQNALYGKHAKNLMKTDVRDVDGNYELSIDLPGFTKDEVQVELKDGTLTVHAEKGLDKDESEKDGSYIRKERYAGAVSRSFYVGDVQPGEVKGKYESGVLTLTIPKKDQPQVSTSNRIAIE